MPRNHVGAPTILVVEDEDDVRELIVDALREAEFKVYSAVDANEAFRVASAVQHVDILFTDVRLPAEIDGLELAERFMQECRCRVVIYATGYSFDPPRMVSPSIILRKPYSVPAIKAAARQMLEVARADDGADEDWTWTNPASHTKAQLTT